MSLEVRRGAMLRALAHPLRLRILSLLTGAPMSASELARELDVSHALASYHLRQLRRADLVELADVRSNRGGRERRYAYRWPSGEGVPPPAPEDDSAQDLFVEAVCGEALRRSRDRAPAARVVAVDAELWLRPEDWDEAQRALAAVGATLHAQARRPREPGSVHVNTTALMFRMADQPPGAA